MTSHNKRCIRWLMSIAIVNVLLFAVFLHLSAVRGESDDEIETVRYWVICNPDSEVNVRGRATADSEIIGRLFLGDHVDVVRTKGRWAYCIGIGNESGDGWVHMGYLTDGEITTYENPASAVISANGRVSARKSVDGGRRKWLSPGKEVLVTAVGGTWSLTDQGYIQSKYLEVAK